MDKFTAELDDEVIKVGVGGVRMSDVMMIVGVEVTSEDGEDDLITL